VTRARSRRRRPRATRRRRPVPRPPAPPRPSPAEVRLLALAEALAGPATAGAAALAEALDRVAAAFGESSPLPAELYRAWLKGRGDKMRALALAWAREQVRLALVQIIERARAAAPAAVPAAPLRPGAARGPMPADALAWLILAGCEAIAHEPSGAAADRLAILREVAMESVERR
jgi:hypothetical protein